LVLCPNISPVFSFTNYFNAIRYWSLGKDNGANLLSGGIHFMPLLVAGYPE
jgi:hypothetical protein